MTEQELLDSLSIDALLDEKDEVKKLLKKHKSNDVFCRKLRGWRLKVNKKLKEKGYDKSRYN